MGFKSAWKDMKNQLDKHDSTEGKNKFHLPFGHFAVILGGFVLALLYLVVRIYNVQLDETSSQELLTRAQSFSERNVSMPFTRGKILDRNGRLLAISTPLYRLGMDVQAFFDDQFTLTSKELSALLKESGSDVRKKNIEKGIIYYLQDKNAPQKRPKLDYAAATNTETDLYWQLLSERTGIAADMLDNVRNNKKSVFVQLQNARFQDTKRKLDAFAENFKLDKKAFYALIYQKPYARDVKLIDSQPENQAVYAKQLHIVGLVAKAQPRRWYPMGEEAAQLIGFTNKEVTEGQEGLEKNFNNLLVGKEGTKEIERDKKGNVISSEITTKVYNPQDLMLSIDQNIQREMYRALAQGVSESQALSGSAVMVDVHTGEILAIANAPSFNPNDRENLETTHLQNIAATGVFEPGSTVKPFVVVTALEQEVTNPNEVINTQPFKVYDLEVRDPASYPSLNLRGILQKSSNVGVARLAARMPIDILIDTYKAVGFGQSVHLGINESLGSHGGRENWKPTERVTVAYGYGLSATPLQLARAYATLGSYGNFHQLSIMKVTPPAEGRRVLSERASRQVVEMMEAVTEKGGTGTRAAVDGYRIAAKTGTARKLEKGRYVNKHYAYTAGLAPASNPRFALVVFIDDAKVNSSGGAAAAPIFSKIMGYTLNYYKVKPDGFKSASNEE